VEASNVEVKWDCLAEEARKKIPLEELRAWLELSCKSSQESSQGSADTAYK
jgi:hypothetical protein